MKSSESEVPARTFPGPVLWGVTVVWFSGKCVDLVSVDCCWKTMSRRALVRFVDGTESVVDAASLTLCGAQ